MSERGGVTCLDEDISEEEREMLETEEENEDSGVTRSKALVEAAEEGSGIVMSGGPRAVRTSRYDLPMREEEKSSLLSKSPSVGSVIGSVGSLSGHLS